jgi:hypothetical protein
MIAHDSAAGLLGGEAAGVADERQVFEEFLALARRQHGKDVGLQIDGDLADLLIFLFAEWFKIDAIGAPVLLVDFAFHVAERLHAFEEGRHGVGVATHEAGEFALGQPGGMAFEHGAHDGELVGRDAGVGDAAAEGLVEVEPATAQQERQTAAFRRVHRQRGFRGAGSGPGFRAGVRCHDITYKYYFVALPPEM